jgi:hypothetical protein
VSKIREYLIELKLLDKTTPIYGVSSKVLQEKVEKHDKWVSLHDFAKEKLANSYTTSLEKRMHSFLQNQRYIYAPLKTHTAFFENNKDAFTFKPLKEFGETISKINKDAGDGFNTKDNAHEKLTEILDVHTTTLSNFTAEHDTVLIRLRELKEVIVSRYPLIPLLTSTRPEDTPKLLEYITLIDKKHQSLEPDERN